MTELWTLYARPSISQAQITLYWEALCWLSLEVFEAAIDECVKRYRKFPLPAEILFAARLTIPLPPSPEQAWLELYNAWCEDEWRGPFQPGDWLDQPWTCELITPVLRELGGMWANRDQLSYYKIRFDQCYRRHYDLEIRRRLAGDQPLRLPEATERSSADDAPARRAGAADS